MATYSEAPASLGGSSDPDLVKVKGHAFCRRTFHRPTYCNYCGDLLWGIINQGFSCTSCNMVAHDRCTRSPSISPCWTVQHESVKVPSPHAFAEVKTGRRRVFCSVCRRRIDDRLLLQCEICETIIHNDCLRLALNNCRIFFAPTSPAISIQMTLTPTPSSSGTQQRVSDTSTSSLNLSGHNWREGNLTQGSRCAACGKNCSSNDCFAGLRCEWCQMSIHTQCKTVVIQECDYGALGPAILPPYSVYIPGLLMADLKSQLSTRRSSFAANLLAGEDDSGQSSEPTSKYEEGDSPVTSPTRPSRSVEDQDVYVYDGLASLRRGFRKQFYISPSTTCTYVIEEALRSFNLLDEPLRYDLQRACDGQLSMIDSTLPLLPQLVTSQFPFSTSSLRSAIGGVKDTGLATSTAPLGSLHHSSSATANALAESAAEQTTNLLQVILKKRSSDAGFVSIYFDWLRGDVGYRSIFITEKMTVADIIIVVLRKLGYPEPASLVNKFVLTVISLEALREREDVTLASTDLLWGYMEAMRNESLVNAIRSRIYLCPTEAAGSSSMAISVFVGNLPTGRSEREYDYIISRKLASTPGGVRHSSIEAIYYEQGAVVLKFQNAASAMAAIRVLRDITLTAITPSPFTPGPLAPTSSSGTGNSSPFSLQQPKTGSSSPAASSIQHRGSANSKEQSSAGQPSPQSKSFQDTGGPPSSASSLVTPSTSSVESTEKRILALGLPNLNPSCLLPESTPLLVLVNCRSGGCQGVELMRTFRLLLNPCQVFSLDQGGPLPALHAFREVPNYRILACGGDGTVGWVLSCLDVVSQESACQSPPVAVLPLGTGNDLARVLHWGSGFTGTPDMLADLLAEVMAAEAVNLDRWAVSMTPTEVSLKQSSAAAVLETRGQTSEDNCSVMVVNNYIGVGIDAELCLDFHNAREEQPDKFSSRIHNKGVYVKMSLKKMMGRHACTDLHKHIRLEVDGKLVDLPPLEGIVVLNIMSWASGCDAWGSEKSSQFQKPAHDDGMLEVIGIGGVVHLGQIQSGIRSATRVAQGEHIHILLLQDLPVQVDGEPWIQPAGHINIRRSALRAVMLKRVKRKMKRRNTEPPVQQQPSFGSVKGPSGHPVNVGLLAPIPANSSSSGAASSADRSGGTSASEDSSSG